MKNFTKAALIITLILVILAVYSVQWDLESVFVFQSSGMMWSRENFPSGLSGIFPISMSAMAGETGAWTGKAKTLNPLNFPGKR